MSSADADLKWRHRWQNFPAREWDTVRDSWLEHIPPLVDLPTPPDPALENLPALLQMSPSNSPNRVPDVPGLRSNALREAVYLFHKCSHANLAAQRLAADGMHSWCLFNAYHSAYLGARGIMALLGVSFPNLKGSQVAIDLFPEHNEKAKRGTLQIVRFEQFMMMSFPKLDQRRIWEGFQRILKMSDAPCWPKSLTSEVVSLAYEAITPPRNYFLYKAAYWPLDDLISDVDSSDMNISLQHELDEGRHGFLLRLSFIVYTLYESLVTDLASYSSSIRRQLDASRFPNAAAEELLLYREFTALAGV